MLAIRTLGLDGPPLPYAVGDAEQRRLHAEVVAGRRDGALLLVQHEPVYTAGRRTLRSDRPAPGTVDTPVVDVDRGGRLTWHGPGQLVGYPVVRLREPVDVVAYVRELESVLLRVVAAHGVVGSRVPGRSGVWVARPDAPAAKVAAIGVRVARGVTLHGFALNVTNDLAPFRRIVPCGIADADVTSIAAETGTAPTLVAVAGEIALACAELLPAVTAPADLPRLPADLPTVPSDVFTVPADVLKGAAR